MDSRVSTEVTLPPFPPKHSAPSPVFGMCPDRCPPYSAIMARTSGANLTKGSSRWELTQPSIPLACFTFDQTGYKSGS